MTITGKIVYYKPDDTEVKVAENVTGEIQPRKRNYLERARGDTEAPEYKFFSDRYVGGVKAGYIFVKMSGDSEVQKYDIIEVADWGNQLDMYLKEK